MNTGLKRIRSITHSNRRKKGIQALQFLILRHESGRNNLLQLFIAQATSGNKGEDRGRYLFTH